jgi:membrane dipeptidase
MSVPAQPCPEAVARVMGRGVVWDNHACMPLRPDDTSFLPQLARCRAAGVDVLTLNIGFGDSSLEAHVRTLATMRHWLARHTEDYVLVRTLDDIEGARAQGRLAVLFDIEGMGPIGDQPNLVGLFYELGVRWMLVAYNTNNLAGGGCQDDDAGLTPLGRRIVGEMADCGMVACGSHCGDRTARELIDYSPNPVLFSHSNARAVWDHRRNIPDDVIRACAARGGVIGLNGIGLFLGPGEDLVENLARHVDHVVGLVGPEHVAIGLDYVFDAAELDELLAKMPETFPPELGYRPGSPLPMLPPEAIPMLAQRLVDLGYGEAALSAILGGNLIRLAREVWK